MPIIFSDNKYEDWLNPEINSPKKVQGILENTSEVSLEINRVSKHVNNPRNNGIECITSVIT